MPGGIRGNALVLSLLEEVTFLTKSGTFEADKRQLVTWDLNTSALKREELESQATQVDLGVHEPGVGLVWPVAELSYNTYPQGVGKVSGTFGAGIGETPLINGFGHALASATGRAPVFRDGASIETSTDTAITPTADGNWVAEDFIGIEDPVTAGRMYTRPVVSVTGALPESINLAFALPTGTGAALSSGDIGYGAIIHHLDEEANYQVQGDVIGTREEQNYEIFACNSTFSLPEAAVNEPQTVSFTTRVGDFTPFVAKSRIAPISLRPTVAAGGEFLLGQYNNTAYHELTILRIGIEVNRTYEADPLGNNDAGLCGWVLTEQDITLTLHIHDNEAIPPGFTGPEYRDIFASDENLWHFMAAWGNRAPGRTFACYFPALHMVMDPEDELINNIAAKKLTFKPAQGYPDATTFPQLDQIKKMWLGQL